MKIVEEPSLSFEINMRIEEGATFGDHPFSKFSHGNVGRAVVKFISRFGFHYLLAVTISLWVSCSWRARSAELSAFILQ
jgi:hypothetical protein